MGKVDNIKSTLFKENMDKAFSFPLLIYFGLFFNVSLFPSLCPYCPYITISWFPLQPRSMVLLQVLVQEVQQEVSNPDQAGRSHEQPGAQQSKDRQVNDRLFICSILFRWCLVDLSDFFCPGPVQQRTHPPAPIRAVPHQLRLCSKIRILNWIQTFIHLLIELLSVDWLLLWV